MRQKDKSSVDTEGRVLLRFSQSTTAYLEWGIGIAYKNEIDLWSEDGSFFTDKIFSKPVNYDPKYYVRDKNGNGCLEHGEQCEQFAEMFLDFVGMIDSKQEIAEERRMILKRAKLMDEIISTIDFLVISPP